MVFHILDGTTVLFPLLSDKALMDVAPLAFFSEILATNQELRHTNLTEYDIHSIFKGSVTRVQDKLCAFLELFEQDLGASKYDIL